MKSKIMFVLVCMLLLTGLNAQNVNTTSAPASKTGIGVLIAQLTENISPSAFTPEFLKNKNGWLQKARVTNDPKGAAWLLKSLQAGLINTAFMPNWTTVKEPQHTDLKSTWVATTGSIKTSGDAAQQLIVLWGSIDPAKMDNNWAGIKPGWTEAAMGLAK